MSQSPRPPGGAERNLAATLIVINKLRPALAQGDRAKLVSIVRELLELDAAMGEQWLQLASLAASNGEIGLARAALEKFIAASNGAPAARYQMVLLLEQAGALREAYELMDTLPPDVPGPAAHALVHGMQALHLGETQKARELLDEAVALQPITGAAWLGLATAADFTHEPQLAERIIAAERGFDGARPDQRAPYYYAKGKVHAERGEHELAFAAFSRGAADMKALTRYDRAADRAHAEESLRGWDAEAIAESTRNRNEPTSRTIFVAGLPRSGTTLVEQILASHSEVAGGGELNRLFMLANEIGGHSFPAVKRYVSTHGAPAAAQLWNHWLAERVPEPGRVVDKTPNTTRFIGLAAALLPDAPLIWLTRDPLDRAWSCFRTFFPASVAWSYDLEDIAACFRLEDELLRRWQEILGDRLLVVPYEGLAADSPTWIRRILAHCGLPEEPQVFTPHEHKRAVMTASVMQVRQPINRAGIGSAEPYRRFLQPFIDAYYG